MQVESSVCGLRSSGRQAFSQNRHSEWTGASCFGNVDSIILVALCLGFLIYKAVPAGSFTAESVAMTEPGPSGVIQQAPQDSPAVEPGLSSAEPVLPTGGSVSAAAEGIGHLEKTPAGQDASPFRKATRTVSRKVVRIELRDSGNSWKPVATGFLVKTGRAVPTIITNAHVVEHDEYSGVHSAGSIRAIVGGDGVELRVERIHLHPDRKNGEGPDVAVLEVVRSDAAMALEGLELHVADRPSELLGANVAVVGFPSFRAGNNLQPSFASGSIVQLKSDGSWLLYDALTTHGGSGSPVFMLSPEEGESRVLVVGVHAASQPIREGGLLGETTGAMKLAVPARRIHEAIEHSRVNLEPVTLVEREPALPPIFDPIDDTPSPEPPVIPVKPVLPVETLAQRIEDLLTAIHRGGNLNTFVLDAETLLGDCRNDPEAEVRTRCIAGHLRIQRGIASERSGNEFGASLDYQAAESHLAQAKKLAPTSGSVTLLLARARANRGKPLNGLRADLKTLQAAHDAAADLLDAAPSRLDQARAEYVLAFVHQFLPCGSHQKATQGFLNSLNARPSRQAEEAYFQFKEGRSISSRLPDLWAGLEDLKPATELERLAAKPNPAAE